MMFPVNLYLHCYNRGGLPAMFQAAHRQHIEIMISRGVDTETIEEAERQLEEAARPVHEQLTFFRKLKLPFAPSESIALTFGDVRITAGQIEWDTDHFEVHSHVQIDAESSIMPKLMDDDSGWEVLPPKFVEDDDDDEEDDDEDPETFNPCDECGEGDCGGPPEF
jgi:hypothetical protein